MALFRPEPCQVVPCSKHKLSHDNLNKHALNTLSRLGAAGYEAYLVGGCVRDIQVGLKPKDFDVVTNATPEQVRAVFRHSRIIGRRFRLVHVYYRGEIIEVSTFRANTQNIKQIATDEEGEELAMITSDNTYGTVEEDAWRRDFTINALFYRLEDQSVLDYTGGMYDIKRRVLRIIGDPQQRYHEDPVRLLRTIRLAAKLDFRVEKPTYQALLLYPDLLRHVAPARLFDEVNKLFFTGHAAASFRWLKSTGYFEVLFPDTAKALEELKDARFSQMIEAAMQETDRRYHAQMSLSPGYLFSVLFWPVFVLNQQQSYEQSERFALSVHQAVRNTLSVVCRRIQIPKRFSGMMQSIWSLQFRLQQPPRGAQRIARVLDQRYARAALDFLELQTSAGWDFQKDSEWWRKRMPKRESRKRRYDSGNRKPRRKPRYRSQQKPDDTSE